MICIIEIERIFRLLGTMLSIASAEYTIKFQRMSQQTNQTKNFRSRVQRDTQIENCLLFVKSALVGFDFEIKKKKTSGSDFATNSTKLNPTYLTFSWEEPARSLTQTHFAVHPLALTSPKPEIRTHLTSIHRS